MNIADVMDEIGTALETIDGLRVFPYYADKVNPPAAVLAWPDPLTYDSTMARGSDEITLALIVLVGRFDARTTRDRLALYLDGSGGSSVKEALETATYTAFDSVRVASATVDSYTSAGIELLGAEFSLDITGRGAA
jgi:hypothetical protein